MKKLVLYSVILMLSQCNKYDDTQQAASLEVPPLTETGANTFGCLVNGVVWANFGETYFHEELGGQLLPNLVRSGFYTDTAGDSTFTISGRYTLSKKGTVLKESSLNLSIPKKGSLVGAHQLSAKNLCTYADWQSNANYRNQDRNPIIVIIKKDSVTPGGRHVVSGTFSGMLYGGYGTPDSLRIVGGVFDALTQ
jgi:hypothetical protein